MWIKISEEEKDKIVREKYTPTKKHDLNKSIRRSLIALCIGIPLVAFSFYAPISNFDIYPKNSFSLPNLVKNIPFILLISLLIALFVFLLSYFSPNNFGSASSSLMICNRCFNTKPSSYISDCECGGEYERIENYKWIEENEK